MTDAEELLGRAVVLLRQATLVTYEADDLIEQAREAGATDRDIDNARDLGAEL